MSWQSIKYSITSLTDCNQQDLIRAVPMEELSRAMLANAKLHAPLAARKAAKDKAGKDIDFEVSFDDDDKDK
jgi:hypothetical protein